MADRRGSSERKGAPDRQFINIQNPDDARSQRHLWSVRSHASRSSRSPARASRAEREEQRRRAAGLSGRSSSDLSDSKTAPGPSQSPNLGASDTDERLSAMDTSSFSRKQTRSPADPFENYPSAARPFLPAALHLFVTRLAPLVPYLHSLGGSNPEQSPWWPRGMQKPALFLAQMLAGTHALRQWTGNPAIGDYVLLSLRGEAFRVINELLSDPGWSLSDDAICPVLQLANYEYYYGGNADNFHTHVDGLTRMINLRGGLYATDLDPDLRRHYIWLRTVYKANRGISPSASPGAVSARTGEAREDTSQARRLLYHMHDLKPLRTANSPEEADRQVSSWSVPTCLLSAELLETAAHVEHLDAWDQEAVRLETGLQALGRIFESGAPNDAYSRDSDVEDVARECHRLALLGSLNVMSATFLSRDHAAYHDYAKRLRNSFQHLYTTRLVGTRFEGLRHWGRDALNGDSQASDVYLPSNAHSRGRH